MYVKENLNDSNDFARRTTIPTINKSEYSINIYRFSKRIFDIVSSVCVLVALSWLLIIVAIAIKLTSEGSVFFLDHRIGLDGEDIHVYKFRTMYIDAEEHIRDYLSNEQYQEWLAERKVNDDPRI